MATINAVGTGLTGASGTGNFVGNNSPTLISPALGAATATSINFGGSTLSTYTAFTTWTPAFTFATPGNLTVAYAGQTGYYTQIGDVVIATFSLTYTPTYTTSSGAIHLTGLPVAANASINFTGSMYASAPTFPAGTTNIVLFLPGGATYLEIIASGSATADAAFTTTQSLTSVQTTFAGTIVYSV